MDIARDSGSLCSTEESSGISPASSSSNLHEGLSAHPCASHRATVVRLTPMILARCCWVIWSISALILCTINPCILLPPLVPGQSGLEAGIDNRDDLKAQLLQPCQVHRGQCFAVGQIFQGVRVLRICCVYAFFPVCATDEYGDLVVSLVHCLWPFPWLSCPVLCLLPSASTALPSRQRMPCIDLVCQVAYQPSGQPSSSEVVCSTRLPSSAS
jgi:hypothetical protein